MSLLPELSFLWHIYAQHATKKEKITPTVSPTTVLPRKKEKGKIARRSDKAHTDVYTSVSSLGSSGHLWVIFEPFRTWSKIKKK